MNASKKTPRGKTTPLPPGLDTPEFKAAWSDWGKHRREIRHKLTPTSVSRQLAMLERLGVEAAIASIEVSIEKGWCGLFALAGAGSTGKRKNKWAEKSP